jgi:hypothetical protein
MQLPDKDSKDWAQDYSAEKESVNILESGLAAT